MKELRRLLVALCGLFALATIATGVIHSHHSGFPAATHYRLDASQSKFIAHAFSGGLLWFKGHDHLVAASDFSGEAQVTRDTVNCKGRLDGRNQLGLHRTTKANHQ